MFIHWQRLRFKEQNTLLKALWACTRVTYRGPKARRLLVTRGQGEILMGVNLGECDPSLKMVRNSYTQAMTFTQIITILRPWEYP